MRQHFHTFKIPLSLGFIFILSVLMLATTRPAQAGLFINAPHYIGLTDGLVGFWSFDGPTVSGTRAHDTSGQGNHGTLTNGPTRAAGKIGQALEFDDAKDSYVAPPLTCSTLPCTVSGWLYTRSLPGTRNGFFRSNDNTSNYAGVAVFVYNTGTISLRLGDGSGLNTTDMRTYETASGLVALNRWYYLTVVVSSMTNITIYVDGQTVAAPLVQGTASTYGAGSGTATIGRAWRDPSGNYYSDWTGIIDDVRIYNRVLSATEIKRLYNMGGTMTINKPVYSGSLQDGLIGAWHFEGQEVSGPVGAGPMKVNDVSGQGNQGSATGASIPKRVKGKIGQALEFDGVNHHINIGDVATYDFGTGQNFTISLWVKTNINPVTDRYPSIISKEGGSPRFGFNILPNLAQFGGDWVAEIYVNDTTYRVTATNDITDETWHHLVFQREGNIIAIFEDGIFIASEIAVTSSIANALPLAIAAASGDLVTPDGGHFTGLIDEVRIYNRALTPQEIKRLYEIGGTFKINKAPNTGSLTDGLVGYWDFDGVALQRGYAPDLSGNDNRGTLTPAASGPRAVKGRLGQALEFDGVDDYIEIFNDPSLNIINNADYTISTWVFPEFTSEANDDTVLSNQNGGGTGRSIISIDLTDAVCSGGAINEWYSFIGGSATCSTVSSIKNNWQHVVLVVNENGASDNVQFFIDGVIAGSSTKNSETNDNGDWLIGAQKNLIDFMQGLIDDVRIYNRALSPQEILRLYSVGR